MMTVGIPKPSMSVYKQIRYQRYEFEWRTGLVATRLFLSINLTEKLVKDLIDTHGYETYKAYVKPYFLEGMRIYLLEDPDIIAVAPEPFEAKQ